MMQRKVYTYDDVRRFYAFIMPKLEKKCSESNDEYTMFNIDELRIEIAAVFTEEAMMLNRELHKFLSEMFKEIGIEVIYKNFCSYTNIYLRKKQNPHF